MKKYLLILSLLFVAVVKAQTDVDSKITNFNEEKIESIEIIKNNLGQAKNRLSAAETLLKNEKDPKQKIIYESEVKRLRERYSKLKLNLISVVTDIKMDEIQKDEINKKRDYIQEAQELLGPAFDTIQRISERPRKIERLRKELQIYQDKLAITQSALKNIEVVKSSSDFKALLPDLEEFLSDATYNVNDLVQEFQIKIDRINRELLELTKDDQTIVGAATELTKQFFSTKGKHLAVSFALFILIVWLLTVLKNKVVLKVLQKGTVDWFFKPISALYGVLTFLFALSISIFSLYIMGDWVLVTIIVLLLSAILWGSKTYIHKYLAEGRLILNLGTIKEGELVIFRGIPWRVKTINFVTIFENEYLDSSTIRVEISQIFHMHSRKILSNEQWFPTRTNDWVMLSDGTFGQVKLQTVEQVIIELKNAERKYLTTVDYLNLRPVNLSHGFSINIIWGIDYCHQEKMLNEIIPHYNKRLIELLKSSKFIPLELIVDFYSAGASSLNMFVEARFDGSMASNRLLIERFIQAQLLKISTENNFIIPFNQVMINYSSKNNERVFPQS
jgi:hypothetical protein